MKSLFNKKSKVNELPDVETNEEINASVSDVADTEDFELLDIAKNSKGVKSPLRKKRIIKWCILGGIVVIIAVVLIIYSISAKNAVPMISVVEIETGDVEETITGSGLVNSELTKTYFSPVNSTIGDISIKKGDSVKAGDKLIPFNTEDLSLETEKAALTAIANDEGYQQSLYESQKAANDFAIAKNNVATYKLLIIAQRNYINDITASISGKTNTLADSAQCARDGIQKKINEKNDELTNKRKALTDLAPSGTPVSANLASYTQVQKDIDDLSNEAADLSSSLSSVYYPANTVAESRQLAEAQTLLSDMQSYLAKDEAKMDAAEKTMLDVHAREQLKANNEVSQLTAEQAQDALAKASTGIYADFGGIISELSVVSGAPATKGAALLTLQSTEDVMVDVTISKYNLARLKLGQKATVTIAGKTYEGSVSRINGIATANSSGAPVITAEVHIDTPDEGIYLGVEGKVVIHTNEAKGVVLAPVETINSDMSGSFCYVIENNVLVRRDVETGVSSDTFIEIKKGVSAGELLVNDYTTPLTEGMAAKALPIVEEEAVSDDAIDTLKE